MYYIRYYIILITNINNLNGFVIFIISPMLSHINVDDYDAKVFGSFNFVYNKYRWHNKFKNRLKHVNRSFQTVIVPVSDFGT